MSMPKVKNHQKTASAAAAIAASKAALRRQEEKKRKVDEKRGKMSNKFMFILLFCVVGLILLLISSSPESTATTTPPLAMKKNGNGSNKLHDDFLGHAQKLLLAGQAQAALQEIMAGQEVYPNSIDLMVHLGIAHASLDQCPLAILAYEKTLQLIEKKYYKTTTRMMEDSTDFSYQTQALTWLGVCHRRLGASSSSSSSNINDSSSAQVALDYLQRSVAHNPRQRENRYHLAISYMVMGRLVDTVQELTEILTMGTINSNNGSNNNAVAAAVSEDMAPKDADYSLLSQALGALEEWQLLVPVLNRCITYTCSFATPRSYTRLRALIEYAVALDQSGRQEESRVEMQKAADLLISSSSSSMQPQQQPEDIMKEVHQQAAVYFQGARRRAQEAAAAAAAAPMTSSEQSKQQETWKSVSETLWSITQTDTPLPAWSIVNKRHVLGFDWPIPKDLVEKVRLEMEDDKAMALQERQQKQQQQQQQGSTTASSTDAILTLPTLSHRSSSSLVSHFTCLTLPVYSLADCNFVAQVQSARLQQNLLQQQMSTNGRGAGITVQTYDSGFVRQDYPGKTAPLHIGVFSADLRPHPMLNLLRAFVKNASTASNNVKVTLYHVSAEPTILVEMKGYYRKQQQQSQHERYLTDVACTKQKWQECVQHARQNRVMVWLETTGQTGSGIPEIAAAGPAPVGVVWAGFPGSMGLSSTLQYMITDHFTVPDSLVTEYPEKMIYVPGSWLITEPPAGTLEQRGIATQANNTVNVTTQRKELREQYQIPIESFVYGNFGRIWKLNDLVFGVWMRIIERVPGSVLVMLDDQDGYGLGDPIPRIRKAWKDFGLAEERLVILPPFRRGEHIDALRALLDVALDSVSYSGGATSYDALFAGVPLVASPGGDKMTQRSACSVLTAADLDHLLVGKDLNEYENIAVRLGLDKDFFTRTKDHIVNATKTSILFNPQIGVNAMIVGLRKAYELWYEGHEPQTIMAENLESRIEQEPDLARDDAGHGQHEVEL